MDNSIKLPNKIRIKTKLHLGLVIAPLSYIYVNIRNTQPMEKAMQDRRMDNMFPRRRFHNRLKYLVARLYQS